ncbi:hypothetical protein [Bacteroides nordii]|jgi:hypothetical protein|nr:hypothetical protein [Bacteroides nordii]
MELKEMEKGEWRGENGEGRRKETALLGRMALLHSPFSISYS